MLRFTVRRLGLALLVAFLVSVATFSLLHMAGDPAAAMAGENATPQDIEYVRKQYGFDRPLLVQYTDWAARALQGNFGISVYLKQPVAGIIWERAPVTMTLGLLALGFALLVSLPLGVLAALRPQPAPTRTGLPLARVGEAK